MKCIAIRFDAEVQPRPGQTNEEAAQEMASFVVEQLSGPDHLQDDYGANREELDEYFAADPERREEMVTYGSSGMPQGGYEGPWLVTESCTASRLQVPGLRPFPLAPVSALLDAYAAYDGEVDTFVLAWERYTAGQDFPCPEEPSGIHSDYYSSTADGSCDYCGDRNRR